MLAAMQVLGFSMEEQDTIFRILASGSHQFIAVSFFKTKIHIALRVTLHLAVLHFGNVYFHRRQLRHGQEGVEMGSDAQVKWVAHLLQLPLDGIEQALTFKMTVSDHTHRWNVSVYCLC
jgi:myosin-15